MLTELKRSAVMETTEEAMQELREWDENNGEMKILTFSLAVVASVLMAGAVVSGAGASNHHNPNNNNNGMMMLSTDTNSQSDESNTTATTAVTTTATPSTTTATTTATTTTTSTSVTTTTTATTTTIAITTAVAEKPLEQAPTTVTIEVPIEEFGTNTLTLEIPEVQDLPEEVPQEEEYEEYQEEEYGEDEYVEEGEILEEQYLEVDYPVEEIVDDYSEDYSEEEYWEEEYLEENNEEFVKEDEEPQNYSYYVTDEEYVLLCNCVAHEAGSDVISEENKAKVVEVIFNRVASSEFPGTIYGVITQRGQFSGCWNYANCTDFTRKVNQSVQNAVSDYLSGCYINHGYKYFYGDGSQNHFRQ